MIASLESRCHSLYAHWILGHRDFKGNELADALAKKIAKEIEGKKEIFYEGVADRSELINLMKKEPVNNGNRSMKIHRRQIFCNKKLQMWEKPTECRRRSSRENYKSNHSGQVALNFLTSKLDTANSDKCEVSNEEETNQHNIGRPEDLF